MSELLQEIIKSLIRSELKTELSNLSLSLSLTFKLRRHIFNKKKKKKKRGFNTLIEPLNEENNMLDKPEKRINHYRLI